MIFNSSILTTEFLTLTLAFLLASVTPGPDFALVLRNSVLYSRKLALYTVLGITLGLFVHLGYVLLGLSFLMSTSDIFFISLKYIGASYLFFLGVKSLLSPHAFSQEISMCSHQGLSSKASLRMRFLNNICNVQSVVFLASLFAAFITPDTPLSTQMGYGFWRIFLSLSWFILVAFVFSHPVVKKRFLALGVCFKLIMGFILCFLAIKIIASDLGLIGSVS